MAPTRRTAFLTDEFCRALKAPTDTAQAIIWDAPDPGIPGSAGIYVPGLGVRCTAGGVKAFVYNYLINGVQRRPKVGRWPAYTVDKARRKAIKWRGEIDDGRDPIGEKLTKRQAAAAERKREAEEMTVRQLAEQFVRDYVVTKRPRTREGYEGQLRRHVLPKPIADMRITEVTDTDINALHREISRTAPVQANRTLAMLSKLFAWAKKAKLCPQDFANPCHGAVERNKEHPKERYPTEAELGAIKAALDAHQNQTHADAIRLLVYTGCRRNEALTMQWHHLDLGKSVWTRPAHLQKANKPHSVPLAPPAVAILLGIRNQQIADGVYEDGGFVFPSSKSASGHILRVRRTWAQVLKQGGIKGAMRLHDLRHGFASMLISSGVPIAVVGELLAHASPQTTRRYAHLDKRVTRDAVDKVASIFAAAEAPKTASVEKISGGR